MCGQSRVTPYTGGFWHICIMFLVHPRVCPKTRGALSRLCCSAWHTHLFPVIPGRISSMSEVALNFSVWQRKRVIGQFRVEGISL